MTTLISNDVVIIYWLRVVWKGLTTYDYIQLRPVREVQSHDRHCCAHLPKVGVFPSTPSPNISRQRDCYLSKQVNRVTPVDQCSNSSAGMANFDRTPSPVCVATICFLLSFNFLLLLPFLLPSFLPTTSSLYLPLSFL